LLSTLKSTPHKPLPNLKNPLKVRYLPFFGRQLPYANRCLILQWLLFLISEIGVPL